MDFSKYCRWPALLLLAQAALSSPSRLADRATTVGNAESLKTHYDYVIVGGGTSGLTVAYRLTEDPSGESAQLRVSELVN